MLIFLLAVMTLTISGLLHLFLVRLDSDHRGQHGDLLVAGLYATQLINSLQLLVVLRKVDIVWGYPFDMVLEAFSFLSLEHILFSLNAVTCVTPPTPALQFLLQTIGLPGYVTWLWALGHFSFLLIIPNPRNPSPAQEHIAADGLNMASRGDDGPRSGSLDPGATAHSVEASALQRSRSDAWISERALLHRALYVCGDTLRVPVSPQWTLYDAVAHRCALLH